MCANCDDGYDTELDNFKRDFRRNRSVLPKYGIDKPSRLGEGIQGIVFGNKKYAIKVTLCETEAKFSKKLIGKKHKHLVKTYSVHKIRGYNLWAIKMERLIPSHRYATSEKRWTMFDKHLDKALTTLNKMGYDHNDEHEGNVMYDPKKDVFKLIDFGFVSKL